MGNKQYSKINTPQINKGKTYYNFRKFYIDNYPPLLLTVDKYYYYRVSTILDDLVHKRSANIDMYYNNELLGLITYRKIIHPKLGKICWIQWLAIDNEIRNQGYAKKLIKMVSKKCHFIGLSTSNPYAICAVESVCNSAYDPDLNSEYLEDVIKLGDIESLANREIYNFDNYSIIDRNSPVQKMDSVKKIIPFGTEFIALYKVERNPENKMENTSPENAPPEKTSLENRPSDRIF